MRPSRELLRLARHLQAAYEQRFTCHDQDRQSNWSRLELRYQEVRRRHRLVEKAHARGWHLAACRHQEHLSSALRACSEAASDMRHQSQEQSTPIPPLQDLLAELQHLHAEFDKVILNARKNFIAVQTDPIVLEEIELGRFLIRLQWPRLAVRSDVECFEVIALDPHPAANAESVTHPHVKNQDLCAGDAAIPLQNALRQGRLVDAFCLMRSVLETYNSASAHVSLSDWEGVSCWNCGCIADSDDSYFCDCCDHDVCDDCISSCEQCDHVLCSSCQTRCDVCNAACCQSCQRKSEASTLSCCAKCLKVCVVCGARVASSELDKATERCPTCCEQQDDDEPEVTESDASIPAPST